MAVRGILRGLTGGASSAAEAEDAPGLGASRMQILDDFEHAGIGWIWATDGDGRLIYLSDNALDKLGRPASEVLSQQLIALFETEKAFYELAYELDHRPTWAWIPMRGISNLLTAGRT